MNLLKTLPVIALFAALGVGVTFAHSEGNDGVAIYKTSGGLFSAIAGRSSCALNVTKLEGGQFVAWPPSLTNTRFTSTLPGVAGELELPVAKGTRGVDEYLKITFAEKNGQILPVAFSWSSPETHEGKSCDGLEYSTN